MIKNISIIGVPMDFGQQLRGVDMGPAAVRDTGLISRLRSLGHKDVDKGDINLPNRGCGVTGSGNLNKEKDKVVY